MGRAESLRSPEGRDVGRRRLSSFTPEEEELEEGPEATEAGEDTTDDDWVGLARRAGKRER